MALIGDTNFSLKPDVNMAAIASLYQKQQTDEMDMKAQQSTIESQQQDRMMNVMKMATDMTQTIIQDSARHQMNAGKQSMMELLGQSNEMTPSDTMTKAGSSFFPGMTQAPVSVPQSQTPEFQNKMQVALSQASPEEFAKQKIKQTLGDPEGALLAKQTKLADLAIKQQTLADKTNQSDPTSETSTAMQSELEKQMGKKFSKPMSATQLKPISDAVSKGEMAQARMLMAGAVGARTEMAAIMTGPGAIEQNKVLQARHVKGLVEQNHDPKTGNYNIPVTLYPELALGLATLTSRSGTVGVEMMDELKQVTTKGQLAKYYVKFTGDTSTDLSNASTQDILKLYVSSIDRQGEIAEDGRNDMLGSMQTVMGKPVDPSVAKASYREYRDRLNKIYESKAGSKGGLDVDQKSLAAELKRRGL